MGKLSIYNLKIILLTWLCAVGMWTFHVWQHPHRLKLILIFAAVTLLPFLLASFLVLGFFIFPVLRSKYIQNKERYFRFQCSLIGILAMLFTLLLADVFTYAGGILFYTFYRESQRFTGYEMETLLAIIILSMTWGLWAVVVLGLLQGKALFRFYKNNSK